MQLPQQSIPMGAPPMGDPGQNLPPIGQDMSFNPPLQEEPSAMSQEDMKANLADMMDKVQERYRDLNAKVFMNKNQAEDARKEMLREVLQLFEEAGVDVTNQESIKAFLDNIAETNPDMYELLVFALEGLMQGEEEVGMEELPLEATEEFETEEMPLDQSAMGAQVVPEEGLPGEQMF